MLRPVPPVKCSSLLGVSTTLVIDPSDSTGGEVPLVAETVRSVPASTKPPARTAVTVGWSLATEVRSPTLMTPPLVVEAKASASVVASDWTTTVEPAETWPAPIRASTKTPVLAVAVESLTAASPAATELTVAAVWSEPWAWTNTEPAPGSPTVLPSEPTWVPPTLPSSQARTTTSSVATGVT